MKTWMTSRSSKSRRLESRRSGDWDYVEVQISHEEIDDVEVQCLENLVHKGPVGHKDLDDVEVQ